MTTHDKRDPFHNVKIANRCKVEWRLMKGTGPVRQCRECLLYVYDLASISQEEAIKLFKEHEHQGCTELYRRADGMYMPRNCPASFMRDCFGPSQNEIWRQVSDQIDARYIAHGPETNFFSRSVIKASHGPWIITLDTYQKSQGKSSVEMTRLRSPFVNSGTLNFKIYPKGFLSDLGILFGMQHISSGDSHFDEQMIVQGDDVERVRKLLTNERIRKLLLWQCQTSANYLLTVQDDEGWFKQNFPSGVDELYFESQGLITDRDDLRRLIELFAEILDQLVRIGVAGIGKPGIDLL
jgi:hypothetical protein